jgi:hypothetical protein
LGRDAVYVLALQRRLPSEVPTLDSIREKVTTHYKLSQAADLARRAGADFAQTLAKAMADGKSFDAAVDAAKLKVVQLPPFSLSASEVPGAEEHISLNARGGLKEIAFSTPAGKASPFRPTPEGGMILFVKALLPLDEAKMKSDLPGFAAYVRQSRQREAFEAWYRKEAERGLRDTPLYRPVQPAPNMAGAAKS